MQPTSKNDKGGGDVVVIGQAQGADRAVSQAGHDMGTGAGADLEAVLVIRETADTVDAVLDLPVTAQQRAQTSGSGVVGSEAGNAVGDLLARALPVRAAGVTAHAEDLSGMGKSIPSVSVITFARQRNQPRVTVTVVCFDLSVSMGPGLVACANGIQVSQRPCRAKPISTGVALHGSNEVRRPRDVAPIATTGCILNA